jgi:hypothetical protein
MLPETRAVTLPVSVSTPPFRGGNGNNTSLETAGQRHSPTEMAVIFPDLTSRRLYESARLSASHGLTSGLCIRLLHLICTNCNAITNSCMNSNVACRVHVAYIRRMDLRQATESQADAPQVEAMRPTSVRAKPQKVDRRKLLTKTDGRSAVGLRIAELKRLFTASLGDRPMTASLKLKLEMAAQLSAFAEQARGRWLRGESSDRIDAICTAERLAERAVAKLRLADEPKSSSRPASALAAHFAREAAE